MTSRFPPPREQLGTKRSAQAGERAHGGRGRALRTTWRALAVTAPSGAHSKRPGWATAPGGWSGAGSVRAPRRRWGKPGSRALRSLFSSPMLLAFFPPFSLLGGGSVVAAGAQSRSPWCRRETCQRARGGRANLALQESLLRGQGSRPGRRLRPGQPPLRLNLSLGLWQLRRR